MRTDAGQLQKRFDSVLARVDKALACAKREQAELAVVAVTKRHPVSAVLNAYATGHRHFGESLVQEAIPKIKTAPQDITWHFIGHLQKNKVRMAVKHFPFIHSIDGLQLVHRIERIAGEERYRPKIFLQVKQSPDDNKHGMTPQSLPTVLEQALACRNVECIGLMAIPPLTLEPRPYFESLRALRDEMVVQFPSFPGLLSMGMSRDFELAIQEGSNYVRIGTGLFGART